MNTIIKTIVYTVIGLFISFLIFSTEITGTGKCPSGFHGNKKSSHTQTKPKQGDSFEYVMGRSLEERIGYMFRNPELKAINRQSKSYYQDDIPLDFLGDAVFNFSVFDILIRLYPHQANLNEKFQSLINNNFQADLAASLNIGRDIYPNKYSDDSKLRDELSPSSRKKLADLLEALVGAVYLDGGYTEARKLTMRLIKDKLKEDEEHTDLLEIGSDTHFSRIEQSLFSISPPYEDYPKRHLESLGSHIFKLHVIDILIEQYPGEKSYLDKKREAFIRSTSFNALNKLDPDSRLKHSETQKGTQTTSAKKALYLFLGTVYLNEGLQRTRDIVARLIEEINRESIVSEDNRETAKPKNNRKTTKQKKNRETIESENNRVTTKMKSNQSLLYEFTQREFQTAPEYKLIEEAGSGRTKTIIIGVWINGELFRLGQGRTKERATEATAKTALKALRLLN